MSGVNPDLMPVPSDVGMARVTSVGMVNPLENFPARIAPSEVVDTQVEKFYKCSIPHASFHTDDGTRITFVNGVFSSTIKHIKDYLDKEMVKGNNYLTPALETEVKKIMMDRDPVGTIRKDLMAEDSDLRATLEREILAKIMGVSVAEVPADVDNLLTSAIAATEVAEAVVDKGTDVLRNLKNLITGKKETRSSLAGDTASTAVYETPTTAFQSAMVGSDKTASGAPQDAASKI